MGEGAESARHAADYKRTPGARKLAFLGLWVGARKKTAEAVKASWIREFSR